jgi:hypothetical protein
VSGEQSDKKDLTQTKGEELGMMMIDQAQADQEPQ